MSLREMYALAVRMGRMARPVALADYWATVAVTLAWAISKSEGRRIELRGQPVNPLVRASLGRL